MRTTHIYFSVRLLTIRIALDVDERALSGVCNPLCDHCETLHLASFALGPAWARAYVCSDKMPRHLIIAECLADDINQFKQNDVQHKTIHIKARKSVGTDRADPSQRQLITTRTSSNGLVYNPPWMESGSELIVDKNHICRCTISLRVLFASLLA